MKPLYQFKDIHSHRRNNDVQTVVNLDYFENIPDTGFYSIGIHPWLTNTISENIDSIIDSLKSKAKADNIVAIGECGIDKSRGASLDIQKDIFIKHISISESLGKPLIIHAVKSFNEIIELRKILKPHQPWIIHGFRGKPQTALQLLKNDIFLSFGEHFNSQSVLIVPNECHYIETDDSNLSINDIYSKIEYIRKDMSTTC